MRGKAFLFRADKYGNGVRVIWPAALSVIFIYALLQCHMLEALGRRMLHVELQLV